MNNQFDSIPFTKELMKLLKEIPMEQWDVVSIPELVKKAISNLEPQIVEMIETADPNVLEIKVGEVQRVHEKIS